MSGPNGSDSGVESAVSVVAPCPDKVAAGKSSITVQKMVHNLKNKATGKKTLLCVLRECLLEDGPALGRQAPDRT